MCRMTPLAIPDDRIGEIKVDMTMVDGEIVYMSTTSNLESDEVKPSN